MAVDGTQLLYLFDIDRESFAAFTEDDAGEWVVRQGGPVALWDTVEQTLTAWQEAEADISDVRLHITDRAHVYWIGSRQITTGHRSHWIGEKSELRWEHHLA
ncbi:hypothetical protein SUDANB105_04626 [Streptomyces sp. enrichment culture]